VISSPRAASRRIEKPAVDGVIGTPRVCPEVPPKP